MVRKRFGAKQQVTTPTRQRFGTAAPSRKQVQQVRQLTPTEIKAAQESARQEVIEKNVEKIDVFISKREQIVASLKAKIVEKQRLNQDTDEAERQLSFEQRFLSEFRTAKQNIQSGATFSSAITVAEQRATGFQERQLAKVEVEPPELTTRVEEREQVELPGRVTQDLVPTEKPRTFIEKVKARGPVETTLKGIGAATEFVSGLEQKGRREATPIQKLAFPVLDQPTALTPKQVGAAAQIAPFFTPAAYPLIAASGIEKFTFPERREEMKQQSASIEAAGFGKLPLISLGKSSVIKAPGVSKGEITIAGAKYAPQVLAGAEVAIGTVGVAAQLTKPTTRILPKPKSQQTFLEVQQVRADSKGTNALFKITQKTPARKAEVTTPLGKLFRRPPKIIDVTKPQTRTITTLQPLRITQKGRIVGEAPLGGARIGAKGKEVNRFLGELSGGQRPISIKDISKLPKEEQFLFQAAAEAKVGRPVPKKFVGKILGKQFTEKQFGLGSLEARRLGTVSRKGTDILLRTAKPGRTITRANVATISEQAKTLDIVTSSGTRRITLSPEAGENILVGEVFAKATPKAFSRAAGKVDRLTGVTRIIQQPSKAGEVISSTGISTIQKPITTQAAKQTIGKAKALAVKLLPQAKPITPSVPPTRAITTQIITTATPSLALTSRALETTFTPSKETIKTVSSTITKPATKTITKPATKTISKPAIKTISKPLQKTSQKLVVVPITKTIQKTTITSIIPTPTPTFGTPRTPTRILPLFGFGLKGKSTVSTPKQFAVQVRRGGVFKTIGIRQSLSKAFSLGRGRVDKTLAATFRIRAARGISGGGISTGRKLRRKKGKPLTFIEKRKFRLDTLGEIGEIGKAKRRKKKR